MERVFHNRREWIRESALLLQRWIGETIDHAGVCLLGLSGGLNNIEDIECKTISAGNTPRDIYRELGSLPVAWEKVKIFLVDEVGRFISP